MSAALRGLPVRHVTLENGLQIICATSKALPYVALRFEAFVGSAADPVDRGGLASVTLDALASNARLAQAAGRIGRGLTAHAEVDRCGLSIAASATDAPKALALLHEAVTSSPASGFALAKARRGMLLESAADDPAIVGLSAVRRAVYRGHPYGAPPEGEARTVERLTVSDAKAFARAQLSPSNAALICTGALALEELVRACRKSFGRWKARPAAPTPLAPAEAPPAGSDFVEAKDHAAFVWAFGWPAAKAVPDDGGAQKIATAAFTGGYTSRLVQTLRVRGAVSYNVQRELEQNRAGGALLVQCMSEPANAAEVFARVKAEAQEVAKKGMTAEEIASARDWVLGTTAFGIERSTDLADALGRRAAVGLPPARSTLELCELPCSNADVNRAARELFKRPFVAVGVGPGPRPKLERRGR